MTEAFETQRALLEYLNKNVNDRSLVQRMIKRWEVYKEWEMYCLVWEWEKAEKKSEPRVEEEWVRMDDKELKELKEKNEKLMAAYKDLLSRNEGLKKRCKKEMERADEQWGLYDHLVFFYRKFQKYHKFVEWKVFWQTQGKIRDNGTQETMEMNRPWVYERYNFEFGEVEQAECDAVEKIIAKRAEEISEIPF